MGLAGKGYDELWCWSVEQPAAFWRGVWGFYGLSDRAADADGKPLGPDNSDVLADASMPGARWFPAMRLNYVDQVLAHADRPGAAIIGVTEDGERRELSWSQLADQVSRLAGTLEDCGVGEGDVVAAYSARHPGDGGGLPRDGHAGRHLVGLRSGLRPEVRPPGWDSSGPGAVHLDRLPVQRQSRRQERRQRRTRRTAARTRRAHRRHARRRTTRTGRGAQLFGRGARRQAGHPGPSHSIIRCGCCSAPVPPANRKDRARSRRVVLEHLKAAGLHCDLGDGDVFFWHTALSWMMWNFQVAGLLTGATIVTYSGSPLYPDADRLWQLVESEHVTYFGTSPAQLRASQKAGLVPGRDHDLSGLRTLGSTGSTLAADLFDWVDANVSAGLPISSISGGTDVVSAFAGGSAGVQWWPVSCRCAIWVWHWTVGPRTALR